MIDKNGDVYQTESLFEYTPHIGKIRSRCSDEKSCSKEESEEIKKIGWDVKKIHDHEIEKEYPSRYPCNQDSVGIEVVAKNTSTGWDKPTAEQVVSIKYLIDIISNIYELTNEDIYEHDKISYKTAGEGAGLYSPN